jgi:hypothetical protein
MKNALNIQNLNLTELDSTELLETTGGDKFMKDLGYALGYAWEVFAQFDASLEGLFNESY